MCPACMSALLWIAAGSGSTGALTALVVKKIRGQHDSKEKPR